MQSLLMVPVMSDLTEEQRKMIDELAGSISRLCHTVIRRRLEQFFEVFFEVIGEETQKPAPGKPENPRG